MAVMRRLAADIVKLEEEDEAFIAGFISRIEGIAIQIGENTVAVYSLRTVVFSRLRLILLSETTVFPNYLPETVQCANF